MPAKRQFLLVMLFLLSAGVVAQPLASVVVSRASASERYVAEGGVEAVRQATIATQVAGQVVSLPVHAGEHVKRGQLLVRLDDRAATQNAVASRAMVGVANAQLSLALREYQRQRQLFSQEYISQGAMDRAQAQYRTAQAAARAQMAQAGASGALASNYSITAPYAGVVASVSAMLGDMALPGRVLMTVYDPAAFKVVVHVPQSALAGLHLDQPVEVEFNGSVSRRVRAQKVTVFPAADPASHTVDVRLDFASVPAGVVPGTFARASFSAARTGGSASCLIPAASLVTRSELTAVYVIAANGHPWLRQVRVGQKIGNQIEVLAGINPGERIALNPFAALQWHAGVSQ